MGGVNLSDGISPIGKGWPPASGVSVAYSGGQPIIGFLGYASGVQQANSHWLDRCPHMAAVVS